VISLNNIWSVAAYELKTLYRSWFFRIFSIITLLILFGMNMGVFAVKDAQWTSRAIPANIPYLNVLFVNVAQAVIAVFLASDFLRRDQKLDTTEVIYARPISNGAYVVGKTLGIMILFTGLVIVVLLMALVFNLILKDTPVVWQAYLLYPLLISIPTLTFILGLSFFLMIVLRSQAITFIILLGYIGLTLFYFMDKLHGLLDYMAFYFPMVYSGFIGFADLDVILLQRGAYFLAGIGFIFATIRFLGRLPQTGKWNRVNLLAFVIFLLAGSYLGYLFHSGFSDEDSGRQQYVQLNNNYADSPVADILLNDLKVKQRGNRLLVSSSIMLTNRNDAPLDTIIFSLNPGLKLDSITGREGPLKYTRNKQLVMVTPEGGIFPERQMRLTFYYRGTPDPSVAYLDITKKKRAALKKIILASVDKEPGFTDPEYVLLTREMLWYPVSGVGFNNVTYQPAVLDFVRFSLSVTPEEGLVAVAPGLMEENKGTFTFRPEQDLNTLPLVIGPFSKMSRTVDQVEYTLYLKKDHDYFTVFFPSISDTLDALIREAKEAYEYDDLDLYYSFPRVSLVETPVQFHPYERPYTQYVEMVQPEMIFLPERGVGLQTLDFRRFKSAEERRNKERNSSRTAEEIEADLFRNFISNTFFSNETTMGRGFRGRGEELITYNGKELYSRNPYAAFPFTTILFPGFGPRDTRWLFRGGVSDSERANIALREQSLVEIFKRHNQGLTSQAIYQSGSFLVNALQSRVGRSEFDSFLYYYIEDHAFTEITFEQLSADFRNDFGVEIAPYLDFIKSGKALPEFLVSEPEYYQTRDDYGDVYVVRLRISNIGGSAGLIDLTFRVPGSGGFGSGGMSTEQRLYELEAGQTKDVQLVFYSQPRMMTVNTIISGNIPSSFSVFLRSPAEKVITGLVEYARESETPVNTYEGDEIVVDNEDPGFSYVSVSKESKVKRFLDSRKPATSRINYNTINPWWTPGTLVRSGDGSNKAFWSTVLTEPGYYDIYVYIPVSAMYRPPTNRSREGGGGRGGGGSRGPEFADKGTVYQYTVSSNEGTETVNYSLDAPEEGWNRLGTFHFPADTATIELTNHTNGSRVFADAVKWALRD